MKPRDLKCAWVPLVFSTGDFKRKLCSISRRQLAQGFLGTPHKTTVPSFELEAKISLEGEKATSVR